jgi:hypothetical protein
MIWKFPIEIIKHQKIKMPVGAKIIHAGLDPKTVPCIWAVVRPDNPTNYRDIFIYGTGNATGKVDNHIGTFVQGRFVWHVFE